jgi:hypothetical protein
LFEALVMAMVKEMPVAPLAQRLGETDKKIWRVVHHYVDQAVEAQDLEGMSSVGIDDTSFRRGQSYVSVFADLEADERRAVFVTEGRDHETVEQFAGFLAEHGGEPERITEVCQDMSQAYLAGVKDNFKNAQVTFDRFHVKQKLSEAIDEVRRAEAKQHRELLKGTRYLWLKRPQNLTAKQQDWLDELLQQPLQTARAYEWALRFDDFYALEADAAEEYLRRWIEEVRQTEIEPLHKFCATLEAHWEGVIRWHHSRVSNECPSYCTSWWGCGGDAVGGGAGAMMTGDGGGVAGRGVAASAAVWRALLAGVVEVGAAAVDPVAGGVAAALPDLDCLRADAELLGDLVEGEHALGAEPVMVGGDAADAAQLGERGDGERLAPAAGQPLVVEDLHRLVVGVLVEQLVDQRDRRRWRGVRFPRPQWPWHLQRVLLAA